MSEESKTETDYVHMRGQGPVPPKGITGLDGPGLSQEDRDLRLAIALQQQENAAAYDQHKRRHDAAVAANTNRTLRSNAHTGLAGFRKKDHGMLTVPDEYTTENAYKKGDSAYAPPPDAAVVVADATAGGAPPQEVADLKVALNLQKVEQTGAGTARTLNRILKEEKEDAEAQDHRTMRSGQAAFHPTRAKKN